MLSYAAVVKASLAKTIAKAVVKESSLQKTEVKDTPVQKRALEIAQRIWPYFPARFLRRFLQDEKYVPAEKDLPTRTWGDSTPYGVQNMCFDNRAPRPCDDLLWWLWRRAPGKTDPLSFMDEQPINADDIKAIIVITRALLRTGMSEPVRLQRTFVIASSKAPKLCIALLHLVIANEIQLDVHGTFQGMTALFMAAFHSQHELISMLVNVCAGQTRQTQPKLLTRIKVTVASGWHKFSQELRSSSPAVAAAAVQDHQLTIDNEPWFDSFRRRCFTAGLISPSTFRWSCERKPITEEDMEHCQRPVDVCITMLDHGTALHRYTVACLVELLGACNENDDDLAIDVESQEWRCDYDDDKERSRVEDDQYWNLRHHSMIESRPFPITTRKRLSRWYIDEAIAIKDRTDPMFLITGGVQFNDAMAELNGHWSQIQNALVQLRVRSMKERDSVRAIVSETACLRIVGIASIVCEYMFRPFVPVC
jgi:hypothetical protein